MLRFQSNRWWAFVLTLCLLTACFFFLTTQRPTAAFASQGLSIPDDPSMPAGPGIGDPDVPITPGAQKTGRSRIAHGSAERVVVEGPSVPAGDGVPASSVLMERLRLFLLSLRACYLRY
jgi:hypothetical protein